MIKTGISGLRGTVANGQPGLSAGTVVHWVQAFVDEVRAASGRTVPRVALGRDARRSSPAIADVARGTLLMAGAEVVDLGLTLTPTVQFYVREAHLDGGLMVTASHNPIIYNGLKFLNGDGFFLPPEAWERMGLLPKESPGPTVALDAIGTVINAADGAWRAHLSAAIRAVDLDAIRALRLRVALDACNGGAARWAEFLEACGCEVILLHSEQHGFFEREAEPVPQHLSALRAVVLQARCDLGFAADPDGDRLVLVDALGDSVSEEHTVVLSAMSLFRPGVEGVLVVNSVTTHAVEEAVSATVVRTPVGEMNVVAGVLEHDALLGGEGSGGIIVPKINMARDGLAAMALILRLLAREQRPLHQLVSEIPRWRSIKSRLAAAQPVDTLRTLFTLWAEEPPALAMSADLIALSGSAGSLRVARTRDKVYLRAEARGCEPFSAEGDASEVEPLFEALADSSPTLDLTDGVKLAAGGVWLSLRPSNTEPIVRIMGEIRE